MVEEGTVDPHTWKTDREDLRSWVFLEGKEGTDHLSQGEGGEGVSLRAGRGEC